MVKVNFYINNALVNPPVNWTNLEIELNFDKDRTNVREHLTLTSLIWARENADFFLDYLYSGVGTGVGILEAPSLIIEIERGGIIEKVFDGYIDTIGEGKYSEITTELPIKERKKIDWLNDIADGFTFQYLFEIGVITSSDFVFVPYILNNIPDYREAAISTLTVAFIAQSLRDAIKELAKCAAALGSYFYYTAVISLILQIIYIVALIITLIKLIKDIVLFLIQPVKYHSCMTVKRMLEAGASYLNLTFKSPDILDLPEYQGLCIIPEKYNNPPEPTEPRIFGFKIPNPVQQFGYYKGTFGQLLRDMKLTFNAKIQLQKNISTGNSELYLVKDLTNLSTPQYQLKDIRNFNAGTNAEEFRANYDVKFLIDTSDKNTVQEYLGTAYQQILSPIRVVDHALILMKGLERIDVPFAQGKMKTELTIPEEIVDFFLTVFNSLYNGILIVLNSVISVINFITTQINNILNALSVIGININFQISPIPAIPGANLNSLIDNRIGMLKIETDFFNVQKLVLLDIKTNPVNTKISSGNETYLSAEYLFKAFHWSKSWLPSALRPTGNQYIIKKYPKVSFTFNDYLQVKDSNIIFDHIGNPAEVVSLKWNPRSLVADMEIRFPKLITDNLQVTELIPDGK